ncbi:UNVERIFIED_CONTAM: hypothetical protein GTU68_033681 [Idotea baltica]|nr:hypothetical protein [Idotea baltica]
MNQRPRRLRKNKLIRNLVAENRFHPDSLIYPLFVRKGTKIQEEIPSMPNIFHWSTELLIKEVESCLALGLNKFLIFGLTEHKDEKASDAYSLKSAVYEAVARLRAEFGGDILIITDVCLCAYMSHGHCGVLAGNHILNDESLELLSKMAAAHAEAGADFVAPSDMMDGRIAAMRSHLDEQSFSETGIISYSVKYASAYYGPFRDAANSAPQSGDRKSYQMDIRNNREAIKEALLDEEEGADMLMVKPALAYLDIIKEVKSNSLLPLACYNVSGEYSMVKAAAQKNWVDESAVVMENMHAFLRAGADSIITYHAKDILQYNWHRNE